MNSTSIFVTGCAGFVGSNLCHSLLEQGYTVFGVDNFDNNYSRVVKERNLLWLTEFSSFSFREVDLTDLSALQSVIPLVNPDIVIHLAARVGVRSSFENAEGYYLTNVYGTECLLSVMRQWGCKKIIFASSSSVYGDTNSLPFRESDALGTPLSPYASTKIAGEKLLEQAHQADGMALMILRFFTVYGPRQRPDLAIHQFLKSIKMGNPINLFGDGSSTRDYTFIADLVKGISAAINFLLLHHDVCETVNLGSGRPISLLEMILTLGEMVGIIPQIEYIVTQPGDMQHTFASIDKAANLLGYRPEVSFREGLRQFIGWYESGVNAD